MLYRWIYIEFEPFFFQLLINLIKIFIEYEIFNYLIEYISIIFLNHFGAGLIIKVFC